MAPRSLPSATARSRHSPDPPSARCYRCDGRRTIVGPYWTVVPRRACHRAQAEQPADLTRKHGGGEAWMGGGSVGQVVQLRADQVKTGPLDSVLVGSCRRSPLKMRSIVPSITSGPIPAIVQCVRPSARPTASPVWPSTTTMRFLKVVRRGINGMSELPILYANVSRQSGSPH